MGFWGLLEVASMPILQFYLISGLGAFLATNYCNILTVDARRSITKIVFVVFAPSLMFSSLAKTVTLEEIISRWYMIINIGLTFFIGGILGWVVVKIIKPKPRLKGLITAMCSTGNLGGLPLIIVPMMCNQTASPFGDHQACKTIALSYASFSMALGSLYSWTCTYHLMRYWAAKCKEANIMDLQTRLILKDEYEDEHHKSFWSKLSRLLHHILKELLTPPMVAAIFGLIFGSITILKNLIIGEGAPLHVFQDSINILSGGAIPCIALVLGGNLIQGLRGSRVKAWIVVGIVCVRYVIQPAIGIWIVKAAANLGFLPSDPLFQFVLMLQYAVPPAMNIGIMAQLFDVGQEECSVLFLWTYIFAALGLTFWSTIFVWILS
ncbi:Auxin efflux carrier family protein [Euphorbia peplus]|nr:Auxin efflux carrier family protein [Euphorbia peplus]